jgi:hypothetical protein
VNRVKEVAGNLPESRVVKIWQDCLAGRTDLVTEEDGPIEVVYPGRLNDDRGADLRDAIVAIGHSLRKGDVEIHVRSSSWWGHGHHRDPLYNRVILHVVYQHDVAAATILQNGRRVPTLALARYIAGTVSRDAGVYPLDRRPMPCREMIDSRDHRVIGDILDIVGDGWFQARAAEYKNRLSQAETDQVLYQGIMGALGYVKNKVPMLELARRLPLSHLLKVAPAGIADDECLTRYQALLLGKAGLLPSLAPRRFQGNSICRTWVDQLEGAWAVWGETATMSASDWCSFKVRPGNSPRRRLAAMSYLLCRFRERGLLPVLVREIERAAADRDCRGLKEFLLVGADGFWAENLDFGLPCHGVAPALLGESRAGVIVANVLLPFAVAWGKSATRVGLAEKALDIYRRYPTLAENTLERHMRRQLGINRFLVNSARRQQGLLYIYKTFCSQGKCDDCPLS